MKISTKKICITSIGIALYVALSMTVKIPIIGHIALDLGYVVLGVYCFCFGGVSGAIVGGCGCVIVSLITSGLFPPGWFVGNIFIGAVCGKLYERDQRDSVLAFLGGYFNFMVTILAVLIGIGVIKTAIECLLFSIPWMVKIEKNGIAALVDIIVMMIGVLLAPRISKKVRK